VTARRARVAGATVPGAAHLRAGKPNQDAIRWLPADAEGERVVMAVADGHGSSACPRSGLGAAVAVEIATEVLWRLPPPVTDQTLSDAVSTIVSRWTSQVLQHLAHHPPTAAELGREGDVENLSRPAVIYGATLLFAIVTQHSLALGQLGDGDVVVVDEGGRAGRPLPADARLIAHETTSLSDKDAVGNVRTTILPTGSCRLVLLATDGYANSFTSDDAFLQVGTDVLSMADEEGIALIRSSLPDWLAETTREGAGDDIGVTIAVLDPGAPRHVDDPPEDPPDDPPEVPCSG
jgi:serine/threonine protein phosphatase PrpC